MKTTANTQTSNAQAAEKSGISILAWVMITLGCFFVLVANAALFSPKLNQPVLTTGIGSLALGIVFLAAAMTILIRTNLRAAWQLPLIIGWGFLAAGASMHVLHLERLADPDAVQRPPMYLTIAAGLLLIMTGATIYRRYARLDGPKLQGPDFMGTSEVRIRTFLTSRTADKLQTPVRRRLIVIGNLLMSLIFSLSFTMINLEYDVRIWGSALLVSFIGGMMAGRFIIMALKPVIALPGEPYDEWQHTMVQQANADGRVVTIIWLIILLLTVVIGLPHEILFGLVLAAIMIAWSTPHFILAWTLPEEDIGTDEGMAEPGHA